MMTLCVKFVFCPSVILFAKVLFVVVRVCAIVGFLYAWPDNRRTLQGAPLI